MMEQILLAATSALLLFSTGILIFVLARQRRLAQQQAALQKLRDAQQRLLLKAAIASEEKERQRIADDLHDDVGGSLSTVRLYLLQAAKKGHPEEARPTIEAAKEVLDEVFNRVRQISHRLSPEMLLKFGLRDALQKMAQKLETSEKVEVTFCGSGSIPRLDGDRELAVYRIVQELIANILRHAGATRMRIGLSSGEEWLLIWLEDNGRGFAQESFERLKNMPGGLGLKNIQSRVDILQAKLNFTVREDGPPGTRITLRVPVHA